MIWIDQNTKALWFQIFKEVASTYKSQNKYLVSVQEPNQLSKSIDGNFDSSFVISEKNAFKELTIVRDTIFWIDVVGEGQNQNAIFARPFNVKEAFPQQ